MVNASHTAQRAVNPIFLATNLESWLSLRRKERV